MRDLTRIKIRIQNFFVDYIVIKNGYTHCEQALKVADIVCLCITALNWILIINMIITLSMHV